MGGEGVGAAAPAWQQQLLWGVWLSVDVVLGAVWPVLCRTACMAMVPQHLDGA